MVAMDRETRSVKIQYILRSRGKEREDTETQELKEIGYEGMK